jgi:NAD(P)-dependent dehydrogenase (short-subunit alcohol dehydrogenase family)
MKGKLKPKGAVEASMDGKIVFITGATSGIGKATAMGLAKLGASIVFTARDAKKAEAAKAEIAEKSGSEKIEFMLCDLASFDSIRECCTTFAASHKRLDVLINNAGVWDYKRRESKDGIENTFATNYLAPFMMTNLLLGLLKKSAPSRIVNVASAMHDGSIDFGDIEFKRRPFSGTGAYRQSKLSLILFTKLLAEKLKGTGVVVNCLHPGVIATNIMREANLAYKGFFRTFGKSPEKGAETSIYLASSHEAGKVTGEYFANKKIARSSRESNDLTLARRLWEASVKYTGLVQY